MNSDQVYSWWMPSVFGLVAGFVASLICVIILPLWRLDLPAWLISVCMVIMLAGILIAIAYVCASWHFKLLRKEQVLRRELRIAGMVVSSKNYAFDSIQRIYQEQGYESSVFLYLQFTDGSKKCVASFNVDEIKRQLHEIPGLTHLTAGE